MASSMSVSEARAQLPDVLDRVSSGEEITITRHGVPVAVVVGPHALRSRRGDTALAAAERVREAIAAGRARRLPSRPKLTEKRAKTLIADVRAARSR